MSGQRLVRRFELGTLWLCSHCAALAVSAEALVVSREFSWLRRVRCPPASSCVGCELVFPWAQVGLRIGAGPCASLLRQSPGWRSPLGVAQPLLCALVVVVVVSLPALGSAVL